MAVHRLGVSVRKRTLRVYTSVPGSSALMVSGNKLKAQAPDPHFLFPSYTTRTPHRLHYQTDDRRNRKRSLWAEIKTGRFCLPVAKQTLLEKNNYLPIDIDLGSEKQTDKRYDSSFRLPFPRLDSTLSLQSLAARKEFMVPPQEVLSATPFFPGLSSGSSTGSPSPALPLGISSWSSVSPP